MFQPLLQQIRNVDSPNVAFRHDNTCMPRFDYISIQRLFLSAVRIRAHSEADDGSAGRLFPQPVHFGAKRVPLE